MDTTWKKMMLASYYISSEMLTRALSAHYINIDDLGKAILESPHFATKMTKGAVSLELITPNDLGFRGFAYHAEFFNRAEKSGLTPLSAYKASLIRLHYNDQPGGEYIHAGMEPVRLKDGRTAIFCLHSPSEDSLWLRGTPVAYDSKWKDTEKFIFERR